MNRIEHLLTCLSEECNEVGQRVSKALRFGLDEAQAGQPFRNRDRIDEELRDLISVALILHAEGVLGYPIPDGVMVTAKLHKIERFMAISREQGVLNG